VFPRSFWDWERFQESRGLVSWNF